MENIFIENNKTSPSIILDYEKGLIEFQGKSYSNNTFEFFEPVVAWIKEYFLHNEKKVTTINFKFIYFNSATNQILFEILDIVKENKSNTVNILWFYDVGNENSIEDYNDYNSEFKDLNIKAICY
jgi:hypothetical protein